MNRRLVNRTHFRKSQSKDGSWQWYWSTQTPNGQDTIAVGGEGYNRIAGALNGFFSSQNNPDWEPGTQQQPMPRGYELQRISDDHYVITHIEESE